MKMDSTKPSTKIFIHSTNAHADFLFSVRKLNVKTISNEMEPWTNTTFQIKLVCKWFWSRFLRFFVCKKQKNCAHFTIWYLWRIDSLSLQPKRELIKLNEEKAIIKIVAKWWNRITLRAKKKNFSVWWIFALRFFSFPNRCFQFARNYGGALHVYIKSVFPTNG